MADQTTNFRINADITNFVTSMNRAQQETQKMVAGVSSAIGKISGIFTAVGSLAAGGALFREAINSTINWTGEVTSLSKALGSSTEQASVMNAALKIVGVSQDVAISASMKLAQAVNKGSEAFQKLGVAVYDSSGRFKPTTEIMGEVNKKLAELPAGMERNTLGIELYGRSWSEVSQILKVTTPVLDEAKNYIEKIGLVVTGEGKAAVEKYKQDVNKLGLAFTALKVSVGEDALPAFESLAKYAAGAMADKQGLGGVIAFLSHPVEFAKYQASFFNNPDSKVTWQQWKQQQSGASAQSNNTLGGISPEQRVDAAKNRTYVFEQAEKEAEAAAKLNARIEELLGKRTKTELELVDIQATAWKQEGADEVLITQWVAAEKDKINHDLMKKVFSDMNKASQEASDRMVKEAKEIQERIAQAYEEGIAGEKRLIGQEDAAMGYAASIKDLTDALNPLIGKDEDLAKAEAALLDGRNKLFNLQQQFRVAWLDMDQAAIDGLGKLIELQTQYNGKIKDNVKLQEEVAVLLGGIVGFNNGEAITRDSWKSQNQYQSAAEIAKQKGGVIPTDKNAPAEYYTVNSSPGSIYNSEGKIVSKNSFGLDWRASGGPVTAFKPYIVGELGPELFVPRSSGAIVPNNQLSGKGGQTINSTVSVASLNVNLPNITQADDYDAIARGIDAALRKYQGRRI